MLRLQDLEASGWDLEEAGIVRLTRKTPPHQVHGRGFVGQPIVECGRGVLLGFNDLGTSVTKKRGDWFTGKSVLGSNRTEWG